MGLSSRPENRYPSYQVGKGSGASKFIMARDGSGSRRGLREEAMATNFTVNGKAVSTNAPPETPLLWVIREDLKLTGTKFGCGTGLCGACMVHIEVTRAFSCQTQVSEITGKSVTTIEGLSPDSSHPLQKAWLAEWVPQCGYCPDHERRRPAQAESETDACRNRRAHEHQHLPLRDLSAHRARGRARGAGGVT